jgi:hypothetical protein
VESTEYDKDRDAIIGDVEFFDKGFFDQVQLKRKYVGVSADHRIQVRYAQEGQQRVEVVEAIPMARSVDWVIYPAAGGEIIQFARESEGAEDVEWSDVTLEDLKANAPTVLEAFKAELAKESADSDDDPDEGGEEGTTKKTTQESWTGSREDLAKLVQEGIAEALKSADDTNAKRTAATKKYREYVAKSGLPELTKARIINDYADALEYVENDVKESVDAAKAEIAEARKGMPRISGMGASGRTEGADTHVVSVKESVESAFGIGVEKKGKKAATDASGKES